MDMKPGPLILKKNVDLSVFGDRVLRAFSEPR
jgi:hypothetical protein